MGKTSGARNQAQGLRPMNKSPENSECFRGLKSNQTQDVGQNLLLSRL